MEALNFVRDTAEDLITKRAFVYTIDNTASARSFGTMPMILDEDQLARMESRGISDGNFYINSLLLNSVPTSKNILNRSE